MIRSIAFALLVAGCNVPTPKQSHGTHLHDAAPGVDASGTRACARAVVVAESDYMSTNVGLVGLDGEVLTGSVASSATAAVALTAPLSGDVVLPTMPVAGTEVVLIDSGQSSSRIVWVDPETAGKRELSVAAGFWSDPHDYASISATKAYVSRYDTNATPGKMSFDTGGDVLIVDPSGPSITGSIDMTAALGDDRAQALPDTDKIVVVRDRAYVLLGARGFSGTDVPSRLVGIDTTADEVVSTTIFDGLLDCAGLALSPDARRLAVLCSGKKIDSKAPSDLGGSGIALVDLTDQPRVVKRFAATELGVGPVGFFGAFSSNSSLFVESFGFDDPATGESLDDTIVRLDVDSGATSVVLRSAGEPFTLGGITCDASCGACFIADAKRMGGVVHRFSLDSLGTPSQDEPVKVETTPGLPPRYVGLF
jgi:hypothetical protein